MKELKLEELLVIDGGSCSVQGFINSTQGNIFDERDPLKRAVGGGAAYLATCWW